MEQDELVYGEMYTFRKLAEIIMRVIEKVVPERLAYEISSYQRSNAIKRNKSQTFKHGETKLDANDGKFSISFDKFKQSYTHSFSDADEEKIEKKSKKKSHINKLYLEYHSVVSHYVDEKT